MAGETTAVYPTANAFVDKTAAATFVPEIWSDEVIASYKTNLKMAPLVKRMAMKGKKGDTIHVPKPVRGAATAKAEATAVNIQANLESELLININRHFEYSRLIEDIVETQALTSLRREYTDDAGYQLAKQADTDLFACGTGLGDGTRVESESLLPASWQNSAVYYNDAGTTPTAFAEDTMLAADVFTDAFLNDMIQVLDDNDVPMDGRSFVIPPSLHNAIRKIDRYVSTDFNDQQAVRTGQVGWLYGMKCYVSSNCPTIETVAENAAASGIASRGAFLFHKDAFVLAEQFSVRSQTQYKQEYLSTLYTADCLYGIETYRPEAGLVLAVPA